ncbi:MAG: pimeloyl-ACP methyl ester carboxylesterase [Polaribacter sp.]
MLVDSSTPLLMLPGMMCDARLFRPQVDALSGSLSIHLAPITAQDSVQALAADILANAPPQFALLGLSMGGIVAMEVMAQAANRVTRLALLDTNPLAELDEVKQDREPQIERVLNGGLANTMRDELKPRYLADGPDKAAILDLCMDMALQLGPEVFLRQSRALQNRPDQCETLKQVCVPTLIMHGELDQLCPPERHQFMHELIPGSRLTTIPNAGHLPTLEQAKASTVEIIDWLNRE